MTGAGYHRTTDAAGRPHRKRIICTVALPGPDGRCVTCHRLARFEAQYGKVVHMRGWGKGAPEAEPKPPALVADPLPVIVAPRIPRRLRPVVRLECPDCRAVLQDGRCPWSTSSRQRRIGGIIACRWPRSA